MNLSQAQIFVFVWSVILETLICPPKTAKKGIKLSAVCSSTGALESISLISFSAACFPTASAGLPLSPKASAPRMIGFSISISSLFFEKTAQRVIPEPGLKVSAYSVWILTSTSNLFRSSFADFACLSATSAFDRSLEA